MLEFVHGNEDAHAHAHGYEDEDEDGNEDVHEQPPRLEPHAP